MCPALYCITPRRVKSGLVQGSQQVVDMLFLLNNKTYKISNWKYNNLVSDFGFLLVALVAVANLVIGLI